MEKCANCEREIGNLEPAHVLNNAIVCEACYNRLRPAAPTPATTPVPNTAPVPYASPAPPSDDVVSTLIPYRNGFALASYYLGIFSLLPCLGAPMGVTAVILGIIGLRKANANPAAKGKVHAWVGIICGALFGLLWILVGAGMVFGAFMSTHPARYR